MARMITRKYQPTPPQILTAGFAIIIAIGALLLALPISSATHESTPFIDALFTSTSAVCVTGLAVVDTLVHWSLFGQIVIMLLVQVGGLGFMTMATLFAFVFRKRISLRDRLILQEAMNQLSMEGIVRLIRKVVVYSVLIELAGALIFFARWSFQMPIEKAAYFSIFHSIMLFNNAGFDLMGNYKSLLSYADDPVINLVTMLLIILGGLGFVVLSDLLEWKSNRRGLTLHSKVVLSMTGFLIIAGAIVIFIFEFTNARTLGSLDGTGKVWSAFLQSVTTRSGGVSTIEIADIRQASSFFMIILMFIGAAPGSTGGGIKVTTFAVLIGAMIAMIRGKQDIVLFRYRLGQDRILKAVTITLFSLMLVIFVTMVLATTEDQLFLKILFETVSAFATVGLTMGLTPELTWIGKIMIILTMYAGRLGPLTLTYGLGVKNEKELYRHPEGKITIG
jgi:trk system potassium uptake protein TrkH